MAETNKNKEVRLAKEAEAEKRVRCIVTRKMDNITVEGGGATRIFSSAAVMENGKRTLKWFKFSEGAEVELPKEIIAQLRGRQISKSTGRVLDVVHLGANPYNMVDEFNIEILG